MNYDLTQPLKDLNGVQLTDASDPVGYTLRSVLVRTALFVNTGNLPTALDKFEAYKLAKRIAQANHYIDLTAEQVAYLKDQGGAMWSPLVLGQLWEMLETPTMMPPRGRVPEYSARDAGFDGLPRKPAADIPTEG